jgi:ArsR family transcriptional regulator
MVSGLGLGLGAGFALVVVVVSAGVIRSSLRVGRVGSISTVVNMPPPADLVNIEIHRYPAGMARTARSTALDPEVRLLAALADPTRLAIVRELAATNETCACDLTSCCDVGQPTVSHHLKVLREAGIVTSERRGQWIWYRLAPDVAVRLASIARGMIPGGLIPASDLVAGRAVTAAAAARPALGPTA